MQSFHKDENLKTTDFANFKTPLLPFQCDRIILFFLVFGDKADWVNLLYLMFGVRRDKKHLSCPIFSASPDKIA